jgi:hypothetical protein
MEPDSSVIETVAPAEPPTGRIRLVNWSKVLPILDASPGVWHLIGEFNQSVRTHINQGRYPNIDPAIYLAKTARIEGQERKRGNLYMMRKPE